MHGVSSGHGSEEAEEDTRAQPSTARGRSEELGGRVYIGRLRPLVLSIIKQLIENLSLLRRQLLGDPPTHSKYLLHATRGVPIHGSLHILVDPIPRLVEKNPW